MVEHPLHFFDDFAIAGEHHGRELASGMHIALRHGPHGGGKLFEDALPRSPALAGVALDAARQAYFLAEVDKNLGRLQGANLFPLEREQAFDDDELARFEVFRPPGAGVVFEIVDGLFDGVATAELAHVLDQQG